ncbi:hypothetical protein [Polystyrenella longa]|uniref:hypothetical protein n=1 Tax=Polystyrenella longa TaxID=2528007 RepID=UPI0011AAA7EA|nr:hypothetical protein [Polystyrenella longa]
MNPFRSPRCVPNFLYAFMRSGAKVLACLLICSLLTGCLWSAKNQTAGLPAQYRVKTGQLLLLSDFKLKESHPLVDELQMLRAEVNETLELPYQKTPITVYLFEDEATYQKYLAKHHPELPHRRAYFVQQGTEFAVYTFWGEQIQEDLMHEYTHGLLHSNLHGLPLWLDEGLAEYFEVDRKTEGRLHPQYTHQLNRQIAEGWQPDIKRLEQITEFSDLKLADYRESWGWVHFMLHDSPESKQVLLDYLHGFQTENQKWSPSLPLSDSLAKMNPAYKERLQKYLAVLPDEYGEEQHAAR